MMKLIMLANKHNASISLGQDQSRLVVNVARRELWSQVAYGTGDATDRSRSMQISYFRMLVLRCFFRGAHLSPLITFWTL